MSKKFASKVSYEPFFNINSPLSLSCDPSNLSKIGFVVDFEKISSRTLWGFLVTLGLNIRHLERSKVYSENNVNQVNFKLQYKRSSTWLQFENVASISLNGAENEKTAARTVQCNRVI